MKEERIQILKMLEEGKISAEEASRLLETMETGGQVAGSRAMTTGGKRNRFLRIRVFEDGKHKVNVNIPIQLAKVAMKFMPQDALKGLGDDFDLEELIQAIEDGAEGKLIEVDDEDTKIEITVE